MAYQKKTTARVRRSAGDIAVTELPKLHRQCLLTVLNYCMISGIGHYVGPSRRDSTTPVRFYPKGDNVEDYLCQDDEPITWAADLARDILPPEWHKPLADDLAALRAQDGPGASESGKLVRRVMPGNNGA